jgi:copper chaperone CopZ
LSGGYDRCMRVVPRRSFEVEHAGCTACAERIRAALTPLATVEHIAIEEEADTARVLISSDTLSKARVGEALARASVGSGHEYRVKNGSWREVTETVGGDV